MRIMIINPDYGMTRQEMDTRCQILSEFTGNDVELRMECLTETKVYVDSAFDVVMAGPEIVKRTIAAERDGFDAVVIYCFSDPALDACREAVSIPVVGGGQASCLVSMMLGRQCGILITDKRRTGITMALVTHEMGFAREVADRICFLDGGYLVENTTPEEFFTNPRSERAKQFLATVL